MFTIEEIKERKLLIFECISGSKAYGLSLPESDTDIKGVFVLPKEEYYGMEYTAQVSDKKNDVVYYELKRFVELLYKNNPNILEMLNTPEESILYKHPLFDIFKPEIFLSKLCKNTFAGYAMSQIKKARGLNKKIMNPMSKERKGVMDFCYILYHQGSVELKKWLKKNKYQQEQCGLVKIPHMKDLYGLYYDEHTDCGYQGIVRERTNDTVILSSIPKEVKQKTILYFNKDGYKKYCKDYREYWAWVENRNEHRYENTISSGKNYDSKNIMHTFRLLNMALEILSEGEIRVKRPDRLALLKVRSGAYCYEELLKMAENKLTEINKACNHSKLQDKPDKKKADEILYFIRHEIYK